MTFENTTGKDLPDYNHFGIDLHAWCVGVSTYHGFWYIEFGPIYFQWSKHG